MPENDTCIRCGARESSHKNYPDNFDHEFADSVEGSEVLERYFALRSCIKNHDRPQGGKCERCGFNGRMIKVLTHFFNITPEEIGGVELLTEFKPTDKLEDL